MLTLVFSLLCMRKCAGMEVKHDHVASRGGITHQLSMSANGVQGFNQAPWPRCINRRGWLLTTGKEAGRLREHVKHVRLGNGNAGTGQMAQWIIRCLLRSEFELQKSHLRSWYRSVPLSSRYWIWRCALVIPALGRGGSLGSTGQTVWPTWQVPGRWETLPQKTKLWLTPRLFF